MNDEEKQEPENRIQKSESRSQKEREEEIC
jgi:hypothetical protein